MEVWDPYLTFSDTSHQHCGDAPLYPDPHSSCTGIHRMRPSFVLLTLVRIKQKNIKVFCLAASFLVLWLEKALFTWDILIWVHLSFQFSGFFNSNPSTQRKSRNSWLCHLLCPEVPRGSVFLTQHPECCNWFIYTMLSF
jgi:hypothetical protein